MQLWHSNPEVEDNPSSLSRFWPELSESNVWPPEILGSREDLHRSSRYPLFSSCFERQQRASRPSGKILLSLTLHLRKSTLSTQNSICSISITSLKAFALYLLLQYFKPGATRGVGSSGNPLGHRPDFQIEERILEERGHCDVSSRQLGFTPQRVRRWTSPVSEHLCSKQVSPAHRVESGRKTAYLHDTVTSILVAGTLVLRGSNSPIDAIISPRDALQNPREKTE